MLRGRYAYYERNGDYKCSGNREGGDSDSVGSRN